MSNTNAAFSLPSGEGQGGVRRASAESDASRSAGSAPPRDRAPPATRPWGRPDAGTSIKTARDLRKRMTPQEAKIWQGLRALRPQGFHFRRQVPVSRFIVDFACLKAGLIVEIDGGQHGLSTHAMRDRVRDAELARAGFTVLRFWNSGVDADLEAVMDTIFARLTDPGAASRRTPP